MTDNSVPQDNLAQRVCHLEKIVVHLCEHRDRVRGLIATVAPCLVVVTALQIAGLLLRTAIQ